MAESAKAKYAVVADEQHAARARRVWTQVPVEVATAGRELHELLEALAEAQVHFVVVHGDDRLVGRLLSAYHTGGRHRGWPLRLMPLGGGELDVVARAVGIELDAPRAARALGGGVRHEDLSSCILPSLRVTSSAEPTARYGFSFGAGWFFTAFEAYYRGGRGGFPLAAARLLKDRLVDGQPRDGLAGARLSIDYHPQAVAPAYLLASALDESWLGLSAGGGELPGVLLGESASELANQAPLLRQVARMRNTGLRARAFERLHLDMMGGYVLDGELFEPARPFVVQVTTGPRVHFVRPRGRGLGRLVRRLV